MGNSHANSFGGSTTGGMVTLDIIAEKANALSEVYTKAKEVLNETSAIMTIGGTCCSGMSPTAGGYSALVDYGNSVYSQAKEKLIRGIAEDIASSLKVSSGFAKTSPIGKVVEKLQKIVPDPRKGKHFVKNSASQTAVCMSLAKAINKRYGSNMVDVDASPEAICRSVGELMYSLFTGLHTEFLSISGDISRNVRNLKALRDYVDATNKRLVELVKESGNETHHNQADNIYMVYEKVRNEIDRQLAILTNNVNSTTGPLGKTLVSLLEENNEFQGIVEDLRVSTGSDAFGDKLGYLLSGISSVSHAAYLIDKSLKTLGMSVSEYKSSHTIKDLRKKVYDHLSKKNPGSEQLRKMLEAADIIYKTDYDHDNIVKYLETKMKSGGGTALEDYSYDLEEATERELGVSRGYMSRTSMSLQMKEHQHYRRMLFEDFKKLLRGHFQQITESVNSISRKIGTEIPISDDLYKFVVRFGQIESVDRENLHMALSGYRKDVTSKHIKNTFMASLRATHNSLESIKSGPQGQRFKDIQDSISQLIKSIDNFSDKFVKSLTEIPISIQKKPGMTHQTGGAYGGDYGGDFSGQSGSSLAGSTWGGKVPFSDGALGLSDGSFNGGEVTFSDGSLGLSDGSFNGGDADEELKVVIGASAHEEFDYFTTMGKVQKELNYYYSIANLKSNLQHSSKELESYGQDYENILGDEIASYIDRVNKDFNREIELSDYVFYKNLKDVNKPRYEDDERLREFETRNSLGKLLHEAVQGPGQIQDLQATNISSMYKYVRTYQKNAKINLFKAAEALDLYMKNFTTAVVAHPDDVKDLVGMLSQISIVAKWFTNRTGDHLAAVFESWPADYGKGNGIGNSGLLWSNGKDTPPGDEIFSDILTKPHYYKWVETNKIHGLGNPNIPWYPVNGHKEVRDVFRRVEKSYRGIRALENIVMTFSRIGDKFGNKSIKNSAFMSHAQIYKSLNDYLVASSIAMGATGGGLVISDLTKIASSLQNLGSEVRKEMGVTGESSESSDKLRKVLKIIWVVGAVILVFVVLFMIAVITRNTVPVYNRIPNGIARSLPDMAGRMFESTPWKIAIGSLTAVGVALMLGSFLVPATRGGGKLDPAELGRMIMSGDPDAVMKAFNILMAEISENSESASAIINKKVKVGDILGNIAVNNTLVRSKLIEMVGDVEVGSSLSDKDITFFQAGKILSAVKSQNNPIYKEIVSSISNGMQDYTINMLPHLVKQIPGDAGKKAQQAISGMQMAKLASGMTGGALNARDVRVSYSEVHNDNEVTSQVYDRIALTIRSTQVKGYNDDFSDTDHIFELMMKSMVCKVMTVVGLFTVFNRPGAVNRSITPLRMILGAGVRGSGVVSTAPVVIDDAVELYIRLPLLAEWYREKFGFKRSSDSNENSYMVSMVPSFDGIWSDFVKLVFVDTDYVKDGTYTDMTLKKLITSINEIYRKYKSQYAKSTVREVINAFVTEINRRYGFIKKNEINEYFDETRSNLASPGMNPYPDDDRTDYDIIGEEDDYGRRPAPSDKFQKITPGARKSHRFAEKDLLMAAVGKFRERVEVEMMQFSSEFDKNLQDKTLKDNKYSFVENILQVVQKLHNAKNVEDRFNIVRDSIQGVSKYSGISYEKTLLFNEVVISPITVLSTVYNLLNKFTCFAHGTNTYLLGKITARLSNADKNLSLSGGLDDNNSFISRLSKELKEKYPLISNLRRDNFAKEMIKYVNSPSNFLDTDENGNSDPVTKGQAFNQKGWDDINKQAWRRFGVNRKGLVKDILNAVFNIGCDLNGLVETHVSSGGIPTIDYSKLQELVVVVFNQIKSSIGEFRNVLSLNTINKYESGTSNNDDNLNYSGSILWLEENLIEKLFNNRDKSGLPEVNESLAASWTDLTRAWNFDASNITKPTALSDNRQNRDTFNDVIAELLYWNYKTDTNAGSRNNAKYSEFPAMYVPIFKSGNFDATTFEEKQAYAQLSRIPSVSAEILQAEAKYHTEKFKSMLELSPWALIKNHWSTNPIEEASSVPIASEPPAKTKLGEMYRWMKDGVYRNGHTSAYFSIAHFMNSICRWFISVAYTQGTFRNGRNTLVEYNINVVTNVILTQLLAGVNGDVKVTEPGHKIINLQAIANMLPVFPGTQVNINPAPADMGSFSTQNLRELVSPSEGIRIQRDVEVLANNRQDGADAVRYPDALHTGMLAADNIGGLLANVAFNKANLGFDMSALFPRLNATLSQVHLITFLFFGLTDITDFEKFGSNIYVVKLHEIAKRMINWMRQGIPQVRNDLGEWSSTTYQQRDQGSGAKTMELFTQWNKDVNDIMTDYMKERAEIDKNLMLARTISASFNDMRLVKSYSEWYLKNPNNLDKWDNNAGEGLIPVFNELLSRYVVGFADQTQFARIYLPLIESFANGGNSKEIMQGNGIKDMNFGSAFINSHKNGGVKGDPPSNTLLYASLGRVIKSLLTRVSLPYHTKYHLISNFIEVPEYLKEGMRANLPVFDKEFEYIKKKAIFIKSIIEGGNKISVRRNVSIANQAKIKSLTESNEYTSENGLHGGMLPPMPQQQDERVNYLMGLVNSIISGCNSIQRCSELVQKELSDVPLYGEVNEGSIKDFRGRYGKNPLTLLSSTTFLLNGGSRSDNWLTPAFSVGSAKFKNLYSTRLILSQSGVEPRMDYVPGIKDIIHQYNAVSGRTSQAPTYYDSLFQQIIVLTRYLTDIIYHKDITGKFLDHAITAESGFFPAQYNFSLERVNGLIENNDTKRAALSVTNNIEEAEAEGLRGESRKTLRIYNILDLNIVPINFHAMQREIPLIHLYNYSYTFDRMIQEAMVPSWKDLRTHNTSLVAIKENSNVSCTKTMFAKCLIYPHGTRRYQDEYLGFVRRLMSGTSQLKLGRPKFNSDQLWGKVLLQDLYPYGSDEEPYDEAGPQAEYNQFRGYQAQGNNQNSYRSTKLAYQTMDYEKAAGKRRHITNINLTDEEINKMSAIGYQRYNTHIVRNMEWFVNLQRYMRYTMRETLKWMDTPVVSGHNVLNSKVTEYVENESYDRKEFD
jgi:hypothetical protein